jgi:hypothetical protein
MSMTIIQYITLCKTGPLGIISHLLSHVFPGLKADHGWLTTDN